ncbi:MAG TPA: hypothetical protein EYP85_11220, partial [Armatimonadetes bacterium]|nr:hypothetical protein [Armatimonadota bacterium]
MPISEGEKRIECPRCHALNPSEVTTCQWCGQVFRPHRLHPELVSPAKEERPRVTSEVQHLLALAEQARLDGDDLELRHYCERVLELSPGHPTAWRMLRELDQRGEEITQRRRRFRWILTLVTGCLALLLGIVIPN